MPTDQPPLLKTSEVAALLHMSPRTVTHHARRGTLPSIITPGGHRRYPGPPIRALADQLASERSDQPTPAPPDRPRRRRRQEPPRCPNKG